MPRYFFHTGGAEPKVDAVGIELDGDDSAWSSGVQSMGELLRDIDGKMSDREAIETVVADSEGRSIIKLQFTAERAPVTDAGPDTSAPTLARYYFHLQDGSFIPDRAGMLFSSLRQVREHAVSIEAAILEAAEVNNWDGTHWQITATDEHGGTVLTLNFAGSDRTA